MNSTPEMIKSQEPVYNGHKRGKNRQEALNFKFISLERNVPKTNASCLITA